MSKETELEAVLTFWFDYHNPDPSGLYNQAMWWQKDISQDNLISEKFGSLREAAVSGNLDHWLESPKGTLAYIILIDQFSRNLYRGSAEMFAHDSKALQAAKHALAQGFDQTLSKTERVFIYMPLEHSENIADQKQSVALFQTLFDEASEKDKKVAQIFLNFAKEHHDIIERFGRFPHRNKILNRQSSAEEKAFLKNHSGF